MIYSKAVVYYRKYYPRKDRRASRIGISYKMCFHYSSRSRLKPIRKDANVSLRRYKGEVADYGWYKKYYEVMWEAF